MEENEKSRYEESLRYVTYYWDKITFYYPRDKGKQLGLPHKFVSPNSVIFRNDQFYWDSYFTILALVKQNKIKLAKGMVDNLIYLLDRFGIVPMRNRYYNLGTSQIPFLTSMAFEIFEVNKDKAWLLKVINAAEKELKIYWMNAKLTETHFVYKGLSRYCDHYITHLGAEHESGWDMTSRFHDRCLNYLPIDLNSCLYKYEMDIAKAYELVDNPRRSRKYKAQATARKKVINELMWNEKQNFFCDYNYQSLQSSLFLSVAGFYPLWANLATPEQAALIREHVLPLFEFEGGITNTQTSGLSPEKKQHDHPNGWPPQQWIVIKGLLNYGFQQDAERIARKWLDMNVKIFEETGKFWEKHNVENCDIGVSNSGRYLLQSGFGWTNAVFIRLMSEFSFK
ncbi:MAG TPA: trehalase family glycosidase [Bacteroidia bacterium]|jgi:alpha,alpha-trehalase